MERVLRFQSTGQGTAQLGEDVGEDSAGDGACNAADADVEERVPVDCAGFYSRLQLEDKSARR